MNDPFSTPTPSLPNRTRDPVTREVESLLWLAAGAAWTAVALTAWSQARKIEARRRTFAISNHLLGQVFPLDARPK